MAKAVMDFVTSGGMPVKTGYTVLGGGCPQCFVLIL